MKKWLLSLLTCVFGLSFATPIKDHTLDYAKLSELAAMLGISKEADLLQEIQKQWLRGPNQERWDMDELLSEKRSYVLNWAKKEGLFNEWEPSLQKYDKALILGATTPSMELRLNYLKALWEKGVRFQEIVFLTGDRPLNPQVDSLIDRCKTESEAAHVIFENTPLPQEIKDCTITFISTEMKRENNQLKRPTTEDTIQTFAKQCPKACSTLFISNQPFCGYQFAVIKTALPKKFRFDVAGKGMDLDHSPKAAATILDSLARWTYQESIQESFIR